MIYEDLNVEHLLIKFRGRSSLILTKYPRLDGNLFRMPNYQIILGQEPDHWQEMTVL